MEFQYLSIPEDRYDDVLQHLRTEFYANEPMSKSLKTAANEELLQAELKYCRDTMLEGLSVMALTKDNLIAGVALSSIIAPGYYERILSELTDAPDNAYVRIYRFLCEQNIRLQPFARLGCDRIFELRICSVGACYSKRGLAHNLLLLAYQRARAAGVPYMKSDASSLYSQRLLHSDGFEVCGEVKYAECRMADGTEMFPDVEAPHDSMQVMIKKLEL